MTKDFMQNCFVCQEPVDSRGIKNQQINLPVCERCCGTELEHLAIQNLLEGMADGFVCGCI